MDVSKVTEITTTISNFWTVVSILMAGMVAMFGWCFALARWSSRIETEVEYLKRDHNETKETHKEKSVAVWAKLDVMQASMNAVLQVLGEMKGRLDSRDDRRA